MPKYHGSIQRTHKGWKRVFNKWLSKRGQYWWYHELLRYYKCGLSGLDAPNFIDCPFSWPAEHVNKLAELNIAWCEYLEVETWYRRY